MYVVWVFVIIIIIVIIIIATIGEIKILKRLQNIEWICHQLIIRYHLLTWRLTYRQINADRKEQAIEYSLWLKTKCFTAT